MVSASGGLVTVIGVVGALAPRSTGLRIPAAAITLVVAALALFLLGIVLAQASWLRPSATRHLRAVAQDEPAELPEDFAAAVEEVASILVSGFAG
jgi:hypothetical protein